MKQMPVYNDIYHIHYLNIIKYGSIIVPRIVKCKNFTRNIVIS